MENIKTFVQEAGEKVQQLAVSAKDTLTNITSEQVIAVLSDPLTLAIVTILIFEVVLYLAFYYDWDLSNMMPHLKKAMSYLPGQKENQDKDDKDPDTQTDDNPEDSSSDGKEASTHPSFPDQREVSAEEMEKK